MACDLTLRPYHGGPLREQREVYRGQAKGGATHSHAYAALSAARRGRRFTPALTWVRRGEKLRDVLGRRPRQARPAGARPRYLPPDRAFRSVGVARYPRAARRPFLMPPPWRGRKAGHPAGPSGSRVFASARASGRAGYTPRGGVRTATVGVCVKCRNYAGRSGRQRLAYAFRGLGPRGVEWVRQAYRARLAIEPGYRRRNPARVATSTRGPLVRLFLAGVALVLRNLWVRLHGAVLSAPRRGGRGVRPGRPRFKALVVWLRHVAEEQLGASDEPHTERPPSQAVAA